MRELSKIRGIMDRDCERKKSRQEQIEIVKREMRGQEEQTEIVRRMN